MSEKVITPKEFGDIIGRSAEWVCDLIRAGKIPTLYPHRRPYLIPAKAVGDFVEAGKCKRGVRAA